MLKVSVIWGYTLACLLLVTTPSTPLQAWSIMLSLLLKICFRLVFCKCCHSRNSRETILMDTLVNAATAQASCMENYYSTRSLYFLMLVAEKLYAPLTQLIEVWWHETLQTRGFHILMYTFIKVFNRTPQTIWVWAKYPLVNLSTAFKFVKCLIRQCTGQISTRTTLHKIMLGYPRWC